MKRKWYVDALVLMLMSVTVYVFGVVQVAPVWSEDSQSKTSAAIQPAAQSAEESTAKSAGSPKLLIPQPTFDFGTVKQGQSIAHGFELVNTGTAPLVIDRVVATCGCTAAVPEKNQIAPGDKTLINVTFDTTGFQGYKVKSVRLYTNDTQNYSAVLTLQGSVKTEVEVSPIRLNFGRIKRGEDKQQVGTVLVDNEADVKILEITGTPDEVQLQIEDYSDGKRSGKKVRVSLSPEVPVGVFRGKVSIKTSSKQNPVSTLPIFARVEGDMTVTPADVSFGLLEGPLAKPVVETVEVINSSQKPLRVTGVKSDSPLVEPTFKVIEEGKRYAVSVTVPQGALGTLRAKIQILTSGTPEEGTLILPVYGIIAKKGA